MPRRLTRIAPLLLALLVLASCGTPRYHVRRSTSRAFFCTVAEATYIAVVARCIGDCVCAVARIAAR